MFLFANLSLAKVSLWVKQKNYPPSWVGLNGIEAHCSPPKGYGGQGMFCHRAVLRADRKESWYFLPRSLTLPQAAGKRSLLRFRLPAKLGVEQAEN